MSANTVSPETPCHLGDIIVRRNSAGSFLAKYLVLDEASAKTYFQRNNILWPNGDPTAWRYRVLVLVSSEFVAAEEPAGSKINVWLHPDEIRLVQRLSTEETGG